jgi:hypothetical protein
MSPSQSPEELGPFLSPSPKSPALPPATFLVTCAGGTLKQKSSTTPDARRHIVDGPTRTRGWPVLSPIMAVLSRVRRGSRAGAWQSSSDCPTAAHCGFLWKWSLDARVVPAPTWQTPRSGMVHHRSGDGASRVVLLTLANASHPLAFPEPRRGLGGMAQFRWRCAMVKEGKLFQALATEASGGLRPPLSAPCRQ